MEIAAPEVVELVCGRRNLKSGAKRVGRQTLKKQFDSGSKQWRVIPTKSTKQANQSREDFSYKHFSLFMSNHFRYQTFVEIFGKFGGKFLVVDDVLSPLKQLKFPTTSLGENRLELKFQTA